MASSTFASWLAVYLGESEDQIQILLKDRSALHFLMTWSIFESKCFNGFVKLNTLISYSDKPFAVVAAECKSAKLAAKHFHERYQDKHRLANLMHSQKSDELESILNKEFNLITKEEVAFLLFIVIYRYRNNIFHGNKGVHSWLVYKQQIKYCTTAMQTFISSKASIEANIDS